jgi:hypothetical protein
MMIHKNKKYTTPGSSRGRTKEGKLHKGVVKAPQVDNKPPPLMIEWSCISGVVVIFTDSP